MNKQDQSTADMSNCCLCQGAKRLSYRISMGVVVILASAPLSADIKWPPPAAVQQRLDTAVEMVDKFRTLLPPPIDGVASLADRLDYDIEAAIGYARDEVRFEPYVGVLRGPDGTAITGVGNAWDQAVMLASLIKTMGADAQVVVGTLSEEDARRLLVQSFKPVNREPTTFNSQAVLDIVSAIYPDLAEALSLRVSEWESNSSSSSLDRDTAAISSTLQTLLDGADVHLQAQENAAKLITALSADYAWVRWRDRPESAWSDVHPAFAGSNAPQVRPQRYFEDEVPPEFQHRVALRLWIERSDGSNSKPVRVPVMDSFDRPTAQLFKHPLALGMAPLSSSVNDAGTLLIPLLDDNLAPGAQAVSELGLTVSADAAGSSAAPLFATLASKMGHGLGALSQAGGGESREPRLTSVVLTVERFAPGVEPVTVERRLVDLRQSEEATFPDSAVFEELFVVDVGAQNQAHMFHHFLTQERALLQAIPIFYAFARNAVGEGQLRQSPQFKALDRSTWLDWDLNSAAFLPDPSSSVVAFRPGPMLVSRRRATGEEKGTLTITDIYSNPVTVLHRDESGNITIDTASAMKQGVRDTLLESHLLPVTDRWSNRSPDRLIVDSDSLAKDKTASAWSPRARELAREDLSNGYVLAVVDQREPHWWRVRLATGETLGMGKYGGQDVAEYIVMAMGAALTAYLFKHAVEECDEIYEHDQEMADCCIVGNLITTYGTSGALATYNAAGEAAGQSLGHMMKAGFDEAPFAAATGYIIAKLSMDVPLEYIIEVAKQGPIANACSAYLGR